MTIIKLKFVILRTPMHFVLQFTVLLASRDKNYDDLYVHVNDCFVPINNIEGSSDTNITNEGEKVLFEIIHDHEGKGSNLDKPQFTGKFYKGSFKKPIRELLRNKIMNRTKEMNIRPKEYTMSESNSVFQAYDFDSKHIGKDKYYASIIEDDSYEGQNLHAKDISSGQKRLSQGLYSKGRKILIRSPLYRKSPGHYSLMKMKRGYSLCDMSVTMSKRSKDFHQPRKTYSYTSLNLLAKQSKQKTPESLPDTEYFMNIKIPFNPCEASKSRSKSRSHTDSFFSFSTGDIERADSALSKFDLDIFDNISDIISPKQLQSVDENTSYNGGKGKGKKLFEQPYSTISRYQSSGHDKKAPSSEKDIFKSTECLFKMPKQIPAAKKAPLPQVARPGLSNIWATYDEIYSNFKADKCSAGPPYSFTYKICACVDILEKDRDDKRFTSCFKFAHSVNSIRSYLSNEIKKKYLNLDKFKDTAALRNYKDLVIFLAEIYGDKEVKIGYEVERIALLMAKNIKSSLEVYYAINQELQAQKRYKHLIPEIFTAEIILKKGKFTSKLVLLQVYGLLVTINSLSRKIFPNGCDLQQIIRKFNNENDLYTTIIKRIYECYRLIVSFKSKKSYVIAIQEQFDYNPSLRNVTLYNSVLLCLDIMHPFAANSLVKFFSKSYSVNINILQYLIGDRYVSLELVLTLGLLLYDDSLNYDRNGDKEMLSWFRFYIETFGCTLKDESVFECLIFMGRKVIEDSLADNGTW